MGPRRYGCKSRCAEVAVTPCKSRSHPDPSGAGRGGGPLVTIPGQGPNGPDSGKRRPVGEGKRVGRAAEREPRRRARAGRSSDERLRRQAEPIRDGQGGPGRHRALAQAVAGRGRVGRFGVGTVARESSAVVGRVLAGGVAVPGSGRAVSVRRAAVSVSRFRGVRTRARVVGTTGAGNPWNDRGREHNGDDEADESHPAAPPPPQ